MIKKKLIVFALLVFFAFLFTGCEIKSKTDISMRETVTIVGIDEKDGIITLTITIELVHPPEGSSDTSKVAIYEAEGESIFEAIQGFHPYTDKIIFWGHVNYIIIGEETARLGVNKYLDIFARDHEIKQNSKIVVAKGMSAADMIKDTNMKDAPLNDILQSLFSDKKNVVSNNQVTILQYLQMVSCRKMCLYVPAIETTDKKEKTEEEKDKKDVMLNGYALFSDDELDVFMPANLARGASWIMDESYAGYITVKDEDGEIVVLEVTHNKPDYKVDYSKEVPEVEITVEFKSNIVEYHGKKDIFKNGKIEDIKDKQDKYVQKQILDAAEFLQENKKDIIGVTNAIFHQYPKKTYYYKEEWLDVFAKCKIIINVESTVDRTYNINQPVGYQESEEE